jgi:chromosome segregation ATPase
VTRLREELRRKEDIIKTNREKVLDATSAVQQIRHVQSELQKKNVLLKKTEARLVGEISQQNQIQKLQLQLGEKDAQLERNKTDLNSLRQEVEQLRRAKENQALFVETKQENVHISSLQRQIEQSREQLRQKDKSLEEVTAKLTEALTASQGQLNEKTAEIDQLKTQQDDQYLEIDRLDSELDTVTRRNDVLEERTASLRRKIQQLEAQTNSLQSELSVAKEDIDSKSNAVKMLADDLSLDVNNKSFVEIIDVLKISYEASGLGHRDEVKQLKKELSETQQGLSESRVLITAIRGENAQLSSRVDAVTPELGRLKETLASTIEERDQGLLTLDRLRREIDARKQTSPSASSAPAPSTAKCHVDHGALHETHKAELTALQIAQASEVAVLRNSHTETISTLHSLLAAASDREAAIQSELLSLRATSSSHEKQIANLTAERERFEAVIEAKSAAASAIDLKFAHVLKKREEEWEARVEGLVRDRERIGKVLMWTWGEKEVGNAVKPEQVRTGKGKDGRTGQPQGFRYKFVDRERSR